MVNQTQLAFDDPAEWLGDWHPLAEQLGAAVGLVTLASISPLLQLGPVQDLPSLRRFLHRYQYQILVPFELPAIHFAHGHTARYELRELVALDRKLSAEPILRSFAPASRRVGRCQLQKFRPLRDLRLVQRYLHAVETDHAHGWHTLVYGLTMAIYFLPLRQGLLGFAHQTTLGFIHSAAHMLRLSERQCRELHAPLCAELPAAVDALLARQAAA
jgi:urease accessory protein UreF